MPVTRKQIGDLLVDNGVITPEELDLARAEHDSTGESIASILRRLGLAGDSQLKNTLELEFGVNFVSLSKFTLDYGLLKMVPLEVVRDHMIVPISHEGNRLTLAMVDPSDSAALDSLQASLNGLQLKAVVCLEEDFMQFIPDSHKPPPEVVSKEVESNGSGILGNEPEGKNGAKSHDSETAKPVETPAVQAQAELQHSIDSAKAAARAASSTPTLSNIPAQTPPPATPPISDPVAATAAPSPPDAPTPELSNPPLEDLSEPPLQEEIESALSAADLGQTADNSSAHESENAQAHADNSTALSSEGIYAAHGDTDGALLSHTLSPEHSLTMDPDTWAGGLSSIATDISTGHATASEEEALSEDQSALPPALSEKTATSESATDESASLAVEPDKIPSSPNAEDAASIDFSVSAETSSDNYKAEDSGGDAIVEDDIPHAATLNQKRAEARASALHAEAHDNTASIVDTGSFPAIKDIRNKYEKEEIDTGTFPTVAAEGSEIEDETESTSSPSQDQLELELARRAQEEAIVLLANQILGSAIKRQCSNIHISPGERQALVQYRLNGALYVDRRLPTTILEALIARYKMMARMSLSERQIPQDGHIKVKSASKEIVCLLSTVPSSGGEHIVIWIV